jgi:hypothetical protein
MQRVEFADALARLSAGNNRLARIAMTAMNTSSSIKVNALTIRLTM